MLTGEKIVEVSHLVKLYDNFKAVDNFSFDVFRGDVYGFLEPNGTGKLGKFWIEPGKGVILKSQMTTRANGTIATEYFYGTQINYGLPDKMIFTVDVKKFKIPKSIAAEMNKSADETKEPTKDAKKGTITITLTNYIVNKGIPDNMFKK
jgi:ABC-type lipopolysaccharide export system ATPase subunit